MSPINPLSPPLPTADARPDAAAAAVSCSTTFLMLLGSILMMNIALQLREGFYGDTPLSYYAFAFLMCLYAGVQAPMRLLGRLTVRHPVLLAATVVLGHLCLALTYEATFFLTPTTSRVVFPVGVSVMAAVGIWAMTVRAGWRRWVMAALVIGFAGLGGWVLKHSPEPFIDTFPMAQTSCATLAHGKDPYAATFKDIYAGIGNFSAYPRGYSVNGIVQVGYSYPPLTLLMSFPAWLISGDHRYANLASVVGIVLAMLFLGRDTHGVIGAVLFISGPRLYSVLESAWTEPMVLVLLAGSLWCAKHWRAALPWVFGLFLCSKQHMFLFAPAALWLFPRPTPWRQVTAFFIKAAVPGLLITVPFVLWNPHAFWHSVIELQMVYPPRLDCLSFYPYFKTKGWPTPPRFTSLLLVPVVYFIAWRRVPNTVWGFALTIAFLAFVTLAFDQAFLNRNFFVLTTMTFALAALPRDAMKASSKSSEISPFEAAAAIR